MLLGARGRRSEVLGTVGQGQAARLFAHPGGEQRRAQPRDRVNARSSMWGQEGALQGVRAADQPREKRRNTQDKNGDRHKRRRKHAEPQATERSKDRADSPILAKSTAPHSDEDDVPSLARCDSVDEPNMAETPAAAAPAFAVGDHVDVDRRFAKDGGVGQIKAIDEIGDSFTVKYTLGGTEKNIPLKALRPAVWWYTARNGVKPGRRPTRDTPSRTGRGDAVARQTEMSCELPKSDSVPTVPEWGHTNSTDELPRSDSVEMMDPEQSTEQVQEKQKPQHRQPEAGDRTGDLHNALLETRKRICERTGRYPFNVIGNAALRSLSENPVVTLDELLRVDGVPQDIDADIGSEIIVCVQEWMEARPSMMVAAKKPRPIILDLDEFEDDLELTDSDNEDATTAAAKPAVAAQNQGCTMDPVGDDSNGDLDPDKTKEGEVTTTKQLVKPRPKRQTAPLSIRITTEPSGTSSFTPSEATASSMRTPTKVRPKSASSDTSKGSSQTLPSPKRQPRLRARLEADGPKLMDDRKFVDLQARNALEKAESDRKVQEQKDARQKKTLGKWKGQVQTRSAPAQRSVQLNAKNQDRPQESPRALHATSEVAANHFQNGQRLYNQKRFGEAAAAFSKALLAGCSDEALVCSWRGTCYDAMSDNGQHKYAEAFVDHSKAIVPGKRAKLSAASYRIVSASKLSLTLTHKRCVLEIADPIRYFNRGRLHLYFERPAEAMQDFQYCLKLLQRQDLVAHEGCVSELRKLTGGKRVYAQYNPRSKFKLAMIVKEVVGGCILQFDGYPDTKPIPDSQIKRIAPCGSLQAPQMARQAAQTPPQLYCCKCSQSCRASDGVLCNSVIQEKHFTCNPCFAQHVRKECGRFEKITRLKGKVFCSGCYSSAGKAARPFTNQDICQHADEDLFQFYLDATRTFEIAEMERVKVQEQAKTEALRVETSKAAALEAAKARAEQAEKQAMAQAAQAQAKAASAERVAEEQRERARRQAAEDRRAAEQALQAALVAQAQATRAKVEEAAARKALENSEWQLDVPAYWRNKSSDAPVAILDNSRFMVPKIQQAIDASNAAARVHFRCNGCGAHTARVTAVHRVENMSLWRSYQTFRQSLRDRLRQQVTSITQLQAQVAHMLPAERILDPSINEFMLWHGTAHETAAILAQTGFDERMANLKGLYGGGSYFADAMCKSSQYARQPNAQGEYCMLYCRVAMGASFCTGATHENERRPPLNPGDPRGAGATFDSIFAESGVARQKQQLHNEFVCFRDYQIYPEFIVKFKRVRAQVAQ